LRGGLNIEATMPPSPSATPSSYDVVVIGGGVGGYTAAIHAGQLGLKTCHPRAETRCGEATSWSRQLRPAARLVHLSQPYS
jgi:dihydrolipoamide dehydrogenase